MSRTAFWKFALVIIVAVCGAWVCHTTNAGGGGRNRVEYSKGADSHSSSIPNADSIIFREPILEKGNVVAHTALSHQPLSLLGRVENVGGEPICAATISLRNRFPGSLGSMNWSVESDIEGLFKFPELQQNLVEVRVKAEGFSTGIFQFDISQTIDNLSPISFVLFEGASLEVAVIDLSGAPVSGASVDLIIQPHQAIDGDVRFSTVTDLSGRARLRNVPPGMQQLEITSREGAFIRSPWDIPSSGFWKREVKLPIPEETVLQDGRVYSPSGIPVSGVLVRLYPTRAPGTWELFETTNDSGGFSFWLPKEEAMTSYRLEFDGGEWGKGRKAYYPNSAPWEMILQPKICLQGVVQGNQTGNPVSGARIALIGIDNFCFSGVDGSFRLDLFPWTSEPQTYTFLVEAMGFNSAYPTISIPSTDEKRLTLVLERAAGMASGRIINEDRLPIEGAFVQVVYPWNELLDGQVAACVTDSSGAFEIGIPSDGGIVDLLVTAQGYQSQSFWPPEGYVSEANVGDIVLSRVTRCVLRVEDASANPICGAQFSVEYPPRGGAWDVKIPPTNADGETMAFLTDKVQRATLYRPGFAPLPVSFASQSDESQITFVLFEGAKASGQVIYKDSKESVSGTIQIVPTEIGAKFIQGFAYIGKKRVHHFVGKPLSIYGGKIEVADLPVGEFEILLAHRGQKNVIHTFVVRTPGQIVDLGQILLAEGYSPPATTSEKQQKR